MRGPKGYVRALAASVGPQTKTYTTPWRGIEMNRTLALAVLALLTLGACVSPAAHRRALGANQALQSQIEDLLATQGQLGSENERLRQDVARLGSQAADAAWIRDQKAKLDELLKRYQQGSPEAVPGVAIVDTGEGLAFRVLGGVLFAPGRIEISEQGKETLRKLVPTLRAEGKLVRVDGHTDDVPIQRSQWKTNLRLSTQRGIAVAEFLIDAGLPANMVGIGGYGEHRPAVQGANDEARQQNRRVEIVMLNR